MSDYFPGMGMTYRQHQQQGAVRSDWKRELHWNDELCYCGKRRNDHFVMRGGDECGDGYYFAPKPRGKGSSRAADPRSCVHVPRSHESDSDEEESLLEQLAQQENELRQLRAFKAAAEAKAVAEAKAIAEDKTAEAKTAEAKTAEAKTAADA